MSHEVNDKLHDAIIDEIVDGLDNLDEKWWGIYNDVASEYGYHPDDDHEILLQIMIDNVFDYRSR